MRSAPWGCASCAGARLVHLGAVVSNHSCRMAQPLVSRAWGGGWSKKRTPPIPDRGGARKKSSMPKFTLRLCRKAANSGCIVAPRWRNREKFDYRIFETPTRKSSTPDFFDDFNGFRGYKRYGFRGFSVRRILFQGILGRFFAYRRVWRRPRPSYGPEPTGARQMYVPKPSTPSWQVYLTRRPAVGRGALSLLRRWCSGGKKPSAQRFSTLLLMLFTIISNAKPVCVAENWSSTHLLRHHRDAIVGQMGGPASVSHFRVTRTR
jgi:hypothetical protein